MKVKNTIVMIFAIGIVANLSSAGGVRDTIDLQLHKDFAHNLGKFKPGSTDIEIFDKSGKSLGTISSLPDFGSVFEGGYTTLVAPSIIGTAAHVDYKTGTIDYGARFLMSDKGKKEGEAKRNEILFNLNGTITSQDYAVNVDTRTLSPEEKSQRKVLTDLISEPARMADEYDLGFDYKLVRADHVLWQAGTPLSLFEDKSKIKKGLLIARVGGGIQKILHDGSETGIGYGWLNGGFNKIFDIFDPGTLGQKKNPGIALSYEYTIKKDEVLTPLDIIAFGGDSGSPVYTFNEEKGKWEILGFHSAGNGASGYGKTSQGKWSTKEAKKKLEELFNKEIATTSDQNIIVLANSKVDTNKVSVSIDGVNKEDLVIGKDIVLGEKGGIIETRGSKLNSKSSALIFKGDYTIKGVLDDFNTAGYIVEEGKTVKYERIGKLDEVIRKIGKGTLKIQGRPASLVTVNVGEGTLELDRDGQYGANLIRLASGRGTVRLLRKNQIRTDKTGFVFGVRAGTLDLYGQSLKWDNIVHVDDKPVITTTKGESTFTFTGNKHEANLTYLGQFNDSDTGKLNVTYSPENGDHSWSLKGDIESKGKLSVDKGTVHLAAPLEFHALNYVDETEYLKKNVKFNDVEVKEGATLTVNRSTTLDSKNIEVKDGGTLSLRTAGKIAKQEQYTDEGAIIKGVVKLSEKAKLNTKVEDKFRGYLDANISGNGTISIDNITEGRSLLKGDNSGFTGDLNVNSGELEIANDKALDTNFKNVSLKKDTKLIILKNATTSVSNIKAEEGSNILGENSKFTVDNTDKESTLNSNFVGVDKLTKRGEGKLTSNILKLNEVEVEKGILNVNNIETENTIVGKEGTLELNEKSSKLLTLEGKLKLTGNTVTLSNIKAEKDSKIFGESNNLIVNNNEEGYIYSDFEGVNKFTKTGEALLKSNKIEADMIDVEKGILSLEEIKAKNTVIEKDATLELEKKVEGDLTLKGKLALGKTKGEKKNIEILGNLEADNGTILIDTELGGDRAPTDVLEIKGNTKGNAVLDFSFIGNGGVTIDGITLVKVSGNSDLELTHHGRIQAGAYDYKLEKNDKGNWVLKNIDALRIEFGSYLANAHIVSQNLKLGSVLDYISLDKNNNRTGHIYGNVAFPSHSNISVEDKSKQIGIDIKSIDERVGIDFKVNNNYIGLVYETGNANGESISKQTKVSAKNEVKSDVFGAYYAHFLNEDTSGLYFATQAKFGLFKNKVSSTEEISYNHTGISVGAEAGYSIPLSSRVYIRPKFNIGYIKFGMDKLKDKAADIDITQNNVFYRGETELVARGDKFASKLGVFYEVSSPTRIKIEEIVDSIKNANKIFGFKLNSKYNISKNLDLNGEIKYSLGKASHSQTLMKFGVDFKF